MLRLAIDQHDPVRAREVLPQAIRGNHAAHATAEDEDRLRLGHLCAPLHKYEHVVGPLSNPALPEPDANTMFVGPYVARPPRCRRWGAPVRAAREVRRGPVPRRFATAVRTAHPARRVPSTGRTRSRADIPGAPISQPVAPRAASMAGRGVS